MVTKTDKGKGALSETGLPSLDKGTRGEAKLVERSPQVAWTWTHGTGTAAEIVVMVGKFVPLEYAEMDEAEEMEGMRHLSLKALEGQWDDDRPDKSEL